MNNNPVHDIQLPSLSKSFTIHDTLNNLDKFITDIILYLAYGIAILCAFKLSIFILNGRATKSYMGTSSLDNSPLLY